MQFGIDTHYLIIFNKIEYYLKGLGNIPDASRRILRVRRELASFGFAVVIEIRAKPVGAAIQSAFLKADTRTGMITVEFDKGLVRSVPKSQGLKIKLEVDTDPPSGFKTETRFLLRPVPFAVRAFSLPDLFAGKMHAVLCRQWKSRVKGRDWYDLVWFAAYHPELRLAHLEQRMRQTGHWAEPPS